MKASFTVRPWMATTVLVGLLMAPFSAQAFRTPFGDRVYDTVERGLAWIRTQIANGSYNDRTTALGGLAIMERRASRHWDAPRGATRIRQADKQRLRAMARYIINNDPGLTEGEDGAHGYETGVNLSFLSMFRSTGGPNTVGAVIRVSEAIANGVAALIEIQGPNDDNLCNSGAWNYGAPEQFGDLSTTHITSMGLSAAASLEPEVDLALVNMRPFLASAQNEDGGLKYRACVGLTSTSAMTAAGINAMRLSGLPANNEQVQRAMAWMQANYRFDSHVPGSFQQSYYYALWSTAKAFELMGDDGGEGIFEDDIGGARDPAADGFPEEPANWYYDFAHTLVTTQFANGPGPARILGVG